ncbi:MAG: hypothetical protein L0Y58_03985, partial [Verrucomicrobia subdivision 3 bacterium]|nr:hypothetical protein [Limisphaerales bacterium]
MKASSLALSCLVANTCGAAGLARTSEIDNDWFRGWPPAEVTYSFSSPIRQADTRLGDIDTLSFHTSYTEDVRQAENFEWLVGFDWRRFQSSVPGDLPVPETLQSAAAVLGFDSRIAEKWRLRLEVLPGIYSDFRDIDGSDVNAPFTVELSYSISPALLVGAQLNVDARRNATLLGGAGVRWRFAEQWLLSLWLPRPQIEFSAAERLTAFAGASFAGGTYVVADDFGRRLGRPELDGEAVDY